MSTPRKRRFIAGAVCPRCGVMDRIVVDEKEGKPVRECIACGFFEKMPEEAEVAAPETRVTRPVPKPAPDVQPIRFFPRKPKT
ncbi:YheV family putative metal-binding protein [Hahella sp. SMD15-11]|uniref:YheV family putative metal-binding protein n=1 Tax=Thermohahella caldifontis TaxID=3142973 RepID=A0AB39UT99_9GAMM